MVSVAFWSANCWWSTAEAENFQNHIIRSSFHNNHINIQTENNYTVNCLYNIFGGPQKKSLYIKKKLNQEILNVGQHIDMYTVQYIEESL